MFEFYEQHSFNSLVNSGLQKKTSFVTASSRLTLNGFISIHCNYNLSFPRTIINLCLKMIFCKQAEIQFNGC